MTNPFQRCASLLANSLRLPLYAVIIIEIISGLQIVYILSKATFDSIDDTTESDFADFFRQVTSVSGGFDFIDAPTGIKESLWIIIAVYLLMKILSVVTLLLAKRVYRGKENYWKSMAMLYLIHSRVLFFPIQLFLLKLIKNFTNCDALGDSSSFYCGSVWVGFNILLATYNFCLAGAIEAYMYQINKVKHKYCAKGNTINKLFLLHKNLMVILYLLITDSETMVRLCAGVSIVFAIGYIYFLFAKLPYYNLRVLVTSTVMIGAIVSLTFILTLRVFFNNLKMLEVQLLILTLLFICIFVRLLNISLGKIINEKWDTPEKAIHFAMLLKLNALKAEPLSAFRRRFSIKAIIARGCLVNQNVDLSEVSQGSKSAKIELELYNYIYERLNNALEKNPKSVILLLFMAKMSLKKLSNLPQAVSLAKRAEPFCQSRPMQNSLDNFNMELNSFYSQKLLSTSSNINIVDYFNFRKIANKLQLEVKADIDDYLDFWKSVKRRDVDVAKMIDLVQKIDKASFRIERIFQTHTHNFSKHFRPILLIYEIYLDVSQKVPVKTRKFIDKFLDLTNNTYHSLTFDAYCEDTAVVVTSIEKNVTDVVIEASGSVKNLFQISKNELVGKSVSCLFPSLFGKQHVQLIKEHIESPENQSHSTYKGYCKTQDNNIFETDIQIQFYPSFENGIRLMTVFRKPPMTNSIIVVGHSGNILECSEALRRHLNIDRKVLENTKMQSIAPDFGSINNSFNAAFQHNMDYLPRKETLALHKVFSTPGAPNVTQNSLAVLEEGNKLQHLLSKEDEDRELLPSPLGRMATGASVKQDTNYLPLASPDRLLTTLASPKSPQIVKIPPIDDLKPRYDKICEEFLSGSKIIIFAQGKGGEELQLEYNVQIEPYLLNGNIYKVLKLTNGEIVAKPPEPPATTCLAIPNEKRDVLGVDWDKHHSRLLSIEGHLQETQEEDIASKSLAKGISFPAGTKMSGKQLHQSISKILDENSEPTPIVRRKTIIKGPVKKFEPVPQQMSVAASSLAGQARSYKEFRNLLNNKKSYFVSKKALGLIYFVILALMGLALVNFFYSRDSIYKVRENINIINLANQRLAQSIRSFQPLLRIYLRVLGIIPMQPQIGSLKVLLYQKMVEMLMGNVQLGTEASNLVDEYQTLFYKNDVSLWRFSDQNTMVSDVVDSFMATNLLGNKMQQIANYTGNMTIWANKPEILYPLNNTVNDYLVSAEETIIELQSLLRQSINDSLMNFRIIIAFASLSIIFIAFAWIILARKIVHSYEFLLRTLLSIKEESVEQRIHQIETMKGLLEYDIETKEIVSDAINFFEIEEAKEKRKPEKATKLKRQEDRFKMLGMGIKLFKQILVNIIAIGVIIAVFIGSLLQSTSDFDYLFRTSIQLSVANKAEYEVSLLVSNFYYQVIFQNDNRMFIRNQSPRQQLDYNYQVVSNLNEDLISSFFEEGVGITDPIVDQLLNQKVCEYLPASNLPLCLQALQNQKVGILAINANFLLVTMYYLDKYFQNPTYTNGGTQITPYAAIARPCLETLEAAYHFLNLHIQSEADTKVTNFMESKTVLTLVILGIIILYVFITQFVTVNKFRSVDMSRGQILKVVPYQIFQENKALKFYIRKEFSHSRALLKHFS